MKPLSLIGLLITFLISCSSPVPKNKVYHLDPNTWPTTTIALDKIIREIRVIPLETRPECLIGYVYQVQFAGDMILVVNSNGVFCFGPGGNFIRRIGNKGKGPGEYISISNLIVNEGRSEILLNDYQIDKLLYFNLKGEFLRSADATFAGSPLQLIDQDLIASHAGRMGANKDNFELALTDWEGQVKKLFFPFPRPVDSDQCRGFASGPVSGSILYHKVFDYRIYEIFHDHIDTLLTLDFGSSAIDTSKYLAPGEFFKSIDEKGKVLGIEYLTNTRDNLAAGIKMGSGIRGVWVLDHLSGKHRFFASDTLNTIGNFKGIPVSIPVQTDKTGFVSVTDGIIWNEAISMLTADRKVTLRREIPGFIDAEKVAMDGNPVLVLYKFREF